MYDWVPPAKSFVHFSIRDLPWKDYLAWKAKHPSKKPVLPKDPKFAPIVRIRLDDPRLALLVADMRRSAALRFDAVWIEEPPCDPSLPGTWFSIEASGPMFTSASRARPDHHFQWGDSYITSRKLRKFIEKTKLRGLQFLPIEGGEKNADWFNVFATEPMGRGIAHPLSDEYPDWRDAKGRMLKGYERRFADGVAWINRLRPGTRIADPFVKELFRLAPRFDSKRIDYPVRFASEYLPKNVDFAYFGWGVLEGTVRPDSGRRRQVFCNERARAALIKSGMLLPRQFEPFETLPAASSPGQILDAIVKKPLPLPRFTTDEFAAARKRLLAKQHIRSNPPKLKSALQMLAKTMRSMPHLGAPASQGQLLNRLKKSQYFPQCPRVWKEVLSVIPSIVPQGAVREADPENRGVLRFQPFEIVPPKRNSWLMPKPEIDDPDSRPSRNDIVLAVSPYGDWYSFRLGDPALPRNARITLWDHETMQPHFEWPSVVDFIQDLANALEVSP